VGLTNFSGPLLIDQASNSWSLLSVSPCCRSTLAAESNHFTPRWSSGWLEAPPSSILAPRLKHRRGSLHNSATSHGRRFSSKSSCERHFENGVGMASPPANVRVAECQGIGFGSGDSAFAAAAGELIPFLPWFVGCVGQRRNLFVDFSSRS
jgi:hypothetical protein